MADTQIRGLGTGSAPLSYTVPGSQEIVLKSLFAAFDGSGAATAFYPCIRIVAPGGGVVGEYITDATVAAGSSAEVSFAPFLRNTPTSSPSTGAGLPNAAVKKTDTQTINASITAQITLDSATFATTDAAIFTMTGPTIFIHAPGLYAAFLHEQNDNVNVNPALTQVGFWWRSNSALAPNAPNEQAVPKIFFVDGTSGVQGFMPASPGLAQDMTNASWAYCSSTPTKLQAMYMNSDVASIQLSTCLVVVVQLQAISLADLAAFPLYP